MNDDFGDQITVKVGLTQETYSLIEAANYLKIPKESLERFCKDRQITFAPLCKGGKTFMKKYLDEFIDRKARRAKEVKTIEEQHTDWE